MESPSSTAQKQIKSYFRPVSFVTHKKYPQVDAHVCCKYGVLFTIVYGHREQRDKGPDNNIGDDLSELNATEPFCAVYQGVKESVNVFK